MNLPVVPKPGALISPDSIAALEAQVTHAIAMVDDLDTLQEWRSQAAALEAYLRGRDLNGPMRAAQRKVEARIGQLLGMAQVGNPHGKLISHAREISSTDRQRFRILARGLERGLTDEEWRSSREPLLKLIQERFPMPRHVPTVVTESGLVRKPRSERIKEITQLAEDGYRADQIAKKTGLTAETVRVIANEEGITLPDAAIGKRAKLDAKRILTESVNGVDAYVSGLSMLDELEMPDLDSQESGDLMQALSRSINGLKKLRNKMEKSYARTHAPAA